VRLDDLQQGEILRVPLLPAVVLVDSDEDTVVGVEDIPLETGLAVVVSQTCDIVAVPETEPWLIVAPVENVTADLYDRSWSGRLSPSLFALPPFADLMHPVADLTFVASIDKRIVDEDLIDVVAVPFEPGDRRRFREWLGRRLARHAFPDHLEDHVLRPLRRRLADRYTSSQQDGPLVRSIEGVWVAPAQDGAAVEILIIVEPGTRTINQLDTEAKAKDALRTLVKPLHARARAAGYRLAVWVKEPAEITGFDLLYRYNEVEVDLPRDLEDHEPAETP
jgi:hypothetical protein